MSQRFDDALDEIAYEAIRSIEKHGEQWHLPMGTGPETLPLAVMPHPAKVAELAGVISRHKLVHVAVSREGAFCMCNSGVRAGTRDNLAWFEQHRAQAVADWLENS